MKKIFLFIMFTILLVTACNSKLSKDLIGMWSIDSITKNDKEILFEFNSNLAYFYKNKTCALPPANKEHYKKGKWEITKKDSSVFISILIEGNELSGIYELTFWKDYDNKLFKVALVNDEIKIICRKGLYNFDKGKDAF